MRIFSYDSNKTFKEIFIYLKPEEINEILGKLKLLVDNPKNHHIHVSEMNKDQEIVREITFSIYTEDNLLEFDQRSRDVLLKDE